jgi:cell division protein FtsW
MESIKADRGLSRQSFDFALIGMVVLLAGTGLSILYSASYGSADRLFHDPERFVVRQAAFLGAGCVLCLIAALIRLEAMRSLIKWITLAALAFQVLPFLPVLGGEMNGAHRWFYVAGRSFQPSEILKPVLILYLSHIFDKKASEEKGEDVLNGLLPPLLISSVSVLLVFLQNDLSSAVMLALISISMFWIAGVPLKFFVAFASVCLPLTILSVLTSEFRLHRIVTYLFPDYDSRGISYQMMNSLKAVRSGGIFGKGIGLGTRKIAGIPEVHADFIFAAFAEEAGFVGVLAFFAVWAFFLQRCFRSSMLGETPYVRYIGFGMTISLSIQTLVNLSVTAGFIPATGIPLPFFSAGGSSLLMTMLSAGFIFNVSRRSAVKGEAFDA